MAAAVSCRISVLKSVRTLLAKTENANHAAPGSAKKPLSSTIGVSENVLGIIEREDAPTD